MIRIVPLIKSSSVEKIIQFAKGDFDILNYHPGAKKSFPWGTFVCTIATLMDELSSKVNILAEEIQKVYI